MQGDWAALRQLARTGSPLHGPGERAFPRAEEVRGNQVARNGGAVEGDERSRGTPRPSVNRSRDQFLSRAGLAANEHRRIAGSDLARAREHRRQRWRRADNLLEHRRPVDLLSQGDVFLLQSLLGGLAIVDIGAGDIPTDDLSLVIANRVGTSQKPAVAAIALAQPHLQLIGHGSHSTIKTVELPRSVIWMDE